MPSENSSFPASLLFAMTTNYEKMSFVDMWEAASGRFQEQTGRKLERNPGISLDDCFRRIEAARPSNSTEKAPFTSEKRHKLTRYTLNTLRCLKLLGGVVAEGAEMVRLLAMHVLHVSDIC